MKLFLAKKILSFFEIDEQKNADATGDAIVPIHTEASRVEVWVVPTDEGRVAAREAALLLAGER